MSYDLGFQCSFVKRNCLLNIQHCTELFSLNLVPLVCPLRESLRV